MQKYVLPCLAGILAACSALPLGVDPDGQDYARPGAYALLSTPSLPVVGTSAGGSAPAFPASNLADGNLGTHWDSGGYRPATAWAAVDLGAPCAVASVVLKLPPTPVGASFDLETSLDGQAWTPALAGQTNASWNPATLLLPPGTTARWVRVLCHNSARNPVPHFSIYELSVQGVAATPTPPPTPTPTPVPTPTPAPVVQGPFDIAATATAQLRPDRLRIDLAGDTLGADARLDGYGPLFGSLLTPWHASCRCDLRLAGSATSVLPLGPLVMDLPPAPGETGVLSGKGPFRDVAAVIWPSLNTAEIPGPPILRIQARSWTRDVFPGVQLDAEFVLTAADDLGNQVTWTAHAASVVVP